MKNREKNELIISHAEAFVFGAINNLYSCIDRLNDPDISQSEREMLVSGIRESSCKIGGASNALFTVMRYLNGKKPYLPAIFTFDELLGDVFSALSVCSDAAKAVESPNIMSDSFNISCDREKLARCFYVIIAAALEREPCSKIAVTVTEKGSSFLFSFALKGISLSDNELSLLSLPVKEFLPALSTPTVAALRIFYLKVLADIQKGTLSFSSDTDSGSFAVLSIPKRTGTALGTLKENRKIIFSLPEAAREEFYSITNNSEKDDILC